MSDAYVCGLAYFNKKFINLNYLFVSLPNEYTFSTHT
jgi:hypothetical protein